VGATITRARLRGRMLRLEAQTSREKERARIAQDLHDDLGASLTEISLLANLAAEDRQANHEDDTLPEVASKAQALVGALDEIVWAINPRHDTLRSLAEYVAAFGGKFLGRAGITLRRDVPRDLPDVSLDAEQRHNIFLAVREALNNAVKHSGASEVWLRVKLESGLLKVSVEDNGRGLCSEVDEMSEGLRGMRERMERIGGACQIESDSTGVRVRLSLPLKVDGGAV
jgi:signal transduction histidine kinase